MKATLEFTLPEEQSELAAALAAGERGSRLSDIYAIARTELKHGAQSEGSMRKALEAIKELAWKADE